MEWLGGDAMESLCEKSSSPKQTLRIWIRHRINNIVEIMAIVGRQDLRNIF